MEDNPVVRDEIQANAAQAELAALRREVADHLREHKEELVARIDRLIEGSMPGYEDLPPDVIADARQSFRAFIQLYLDYFEAGELPEKYIVELANDVGRRRVGQGLDFAAVTGSYITGEQHVWDSLTEVLIERDYPAGAWLALVEMRDRFNNLVRRHLSRAYQSEERSTVQRQVDEFRALSNLGQTIVSTVDMERVLGQILEVTTSLMQAKMGSIMLLDRTGDHLEPVVDMGLSRTWVQHEKVPLNSSLSGVAIQRNEHVQAKDDELAGFTLPRAAAGRKIRSALSIPITVGTEPIGVIELYDSTPRTYTDLDITMLTTFGPQAGVAIKNAQLFRDERKRRLQAMTLNEVAQAISETRDLDELLEAICEKTAMALQVDRCSLFFYEPEVNALTFVAGWGRSTLQVWLLNQFHIPMSELGQATARAIRTREPVLAEDAGDELSLESRIFRGTGVRSYLQVPLIVKDELIGLMSLEFTRGEVKFGPEDIALADSLARQAAVAIQNRKLQEKLFEQQMTIRNAEINENLYRERERSEAVIKASPDAVFLIDRDHKVRLINPAAEYLTGWSLDEAEGMNCHELLYGEESEAGACPYNACPLNRVLKGEQLTYSEEELVTRTGERIPVGGTFSPILGPDGKVESVVAIYRDIRELKELENYALMQREMDIASGIQSSLLPREKLKVNGISVSARQHQARIVGGDWYDYWTYGDRMFLVVGDASGTGVGAALFATMAMSALRVEAREHERIKEIMEHVNKNLFLSNRSESFVTVFFAVLDLKTMTLSYANAGHEDPLVVGRDGKHVEELSSVNRSLLGIFSRANLDVQRRVLNPGERIVVYTDGVIDSQSSKGKFFGLKRLNRFVETNRQLPAEEFIDSLIDSVLEFCHGETKDDITVLVCDIP